MRDASLGTTPLHHMASRGEEDTVRLLLEKGADPNARAHTSLETPLHWAVRDRARVSLIEVLLKFGADPTCKDSQGETPIDYNVHDPHLFGPTNSRKLPSGSRKTVRKMPLPSDSGSAIGHFPSSWTPAFFRRSTAVFMSDTRIVR